MKKKLFYLTLIYFSIMLTNLGTIKAEEPNMKIEYEGGGKATWAVSDACVTRQVGKVFGVKITLMNSSIGNRQAYFVIRNYNAFDITHIPDGKEGELAELISEGKIDESKSNQILELSGTFNSDFDTATGEYFKNSLNNESVSKILRIFFGDNYSSEINNSKNDNAYFKIEPIYAFESCDYDTNIYPGGTPQKFFVVGTTRTIRNAIIDASNNHVFNMNKDNIPKYDIWRFVYGFSLNNDVTIGTDTYKKVDVVNIKQEDNYVLTELDKIMYDYWDHGGYGLNIMKVKDVVNYFVCDYNNYDHFKNNILYGPDNSNGGADGKTNCCKDTSIINQGGTHFYIDHPECIEPAEYVFNGATCSYTQSVKSTLKTKDKNSSNIWAKIFANMYNEDKKNITNYLKKKITDDVTLICEEDITITYPAFVDKKIIKGGFFVWPKIGELRINSTVQCRPYVDIFTSNSLNLNDISNKIKKQIQEYSLEADFKLEYSDSEYGKGLVFDIGTKGKIESIKDNPTTLYDKSYDIDYDSSNNTIDTINELKNIVYKFNAQTTYKLPTTYRFQNIETLKYAKDVDSVPNEMVSHYNDRKEGVLPISYNYSDGEKGNVKIYFQYIGGNKNINIKNVKDSENKTANSNYTCEYTITDDKTNNPCTCPSGTKNSGIDITKLLCEANEENFDGTKTKEYYSCPLLQEKYCDDPNLVCKCDDGKYLGIVTNKDKCDSLKKSCNSTNNVNITCSEGNNILISQACSEDESCKNYFCNINNTNTCRYECPKDSDNPGKDITREVFAYFAKEIMTNETNKKNLNYNEMLEIAHQTVSGKSFGFSNTCWNTNKKPNTNIVYRTISLDNPFPGKDGEGRTPGTNWYEYSYKYLDDNNKIVSRSVSGNELYTEKKPIYVIELTPTIIKNIRNYNNNHKYDDFELDCKSYGNGKCISSFLHDNEYFSLSGTCSKATNKNKFDECIK